VWNGGTGQREAGRLDFVLSDNGQSAENGLEIRRSVIPRFASVPVKGHGTLLTSSSPESTVSETSERFGEFS
jgi:hypothetical protein